MNNQDTQAPTFWRKCSICKKELPFSSMYYQCSVSTCQHKRKGFRFCSVSCWDAHLGFANHREAWAEEVNSPSKEDHMKSLETDKNRAPKREPVRKVIAETPVGSVGEGQTDYSGQAKSLNLETLVVVSKIKKLIKEQTSYSTSQCCIDALTEKVAEECLKAAENATLAGRKTVMGRDVK